MFVNGAQGTMDIDGMGPRDWAEMERIGAKLAAEVAAVAQGIEPHKDVTVHNRHVQNAGCRWPEKPDHSFQY